MKDQLWYQLYQAAILELEAALLKERVDAAEAAIQERSAELPRGTEHDKERWAIADAKSALAALRRKELRASS
jgi:hypothetical protein